MDTTQWNTAFTNMIRNTNAAGWGNWTLNPGIAAGAVGIVDPNTGSFTPVAMMPGARIITLNSPQTWNMESSSVHKTTTDVSFAGGYVDPSSGTTVTAGLDVAWNFAQEGSLVSNATVLGTAQVDDFGTLMQQQYSWLLGQAQSVGYATSSGIVQGFGLITNVTRCSGGVNIGSLTDSSSFSITGSVDGVNAMTGGGDVSAGVKGSYKQLDESASFEQHLWPAEANVAASNDIALQYQFATFDGQLVMPTWVQPLTGFSFLFNNAHGGTYIAECSVEYTSASSGSSNPITQSVTAPGGQAHSINGVPLDAQNVKVKIHLKAGDDYSYTYAAPLTSFLRGQATYDIYGVWPWSSHVNVSTG